MSKIYYVSHVAQFIFFRSMKKVEKIIGNKALVELMLTEWTVSITLKLNIQFKIPRKNTSNYLLSNKYLPARMILTYNFGLAPQKYSVLFLSPLINYYSTNYFIVKAALVFIVM